MAQQTGYTKKQKFIIALVGVIITGLSGLSGSIITSINAKDEKKENTVQIRQAIIHNIKTIDSLQTEIKYMKMADAAMLISINETNRKMYEQQTTLTQLITIIKLKWGINL